MYFEEAVGLLVIVVVVRPAFSPVKHVAIRPSASSKMKGTGDLTTHEGSTPHGSLVFLSIGGLPDSSESTSAFSNPSFLLTCCFSCESDSCLAAESLDVADEEPF